MPEAHPRAMKILEVFGLRLRLRGPFGLGLQGYLNFLREKT